MIEKQIFEALSTAKNCVITSHKSPDGDSIGSSMALFYFLEKLGINAKVVHPDKAPNYIQSIPGVDSIICFDEQTEEAKALLANADLIFCLDYNEASRVGPFMQPDLEASKAVKVMIDHHLNPSDLCDFVISNTKKASTCELIYDWIEANDKLDLIDETIGSCIYIGTMTDTGSFRFPSVQSKTHKMIADLIDKGVKPFIWHENLFDNNTIDRIKLRGFALSEKLVCLDNLPVAFSSLNQSELAKLNYQKGDTEGIVNQILGISGIKMAVFFMEADGEVKISFRSKGNYVVNEMAKMHFNGGGHAYASGGRTELSLEDTIELFKNVVINFSPNE